MDAGALARRAAETAARNSYGRLVAYLAARSRDVAAAEDALSQAFAAALAQWPRDGVPDRPEAWLLAVARRRGIDAVRRRRGGEAAGRQLAMLAEELVETPAGGEIPDERLRLLFVCAHPAIEASVRAPLMLQTILGLDAATIASAFLVSPAAMAQRLVRAKTRIRQTAMRFAVPERSEMPGRLAAVLDAVYAAYSEGWTDAAGADLRRRNLAGEGIWLGRLIVSMLPEEPEAAGLLALMLYAESRRAARRGPSGEYIALSQQDMSLWDASMIAEADRMLRQAAAKTSPGRYQIEAAIQSAHAGRRYGRGVDWPAIRNLYAALAAMTASPVAAINLAVATAECEGPLAGLDLLDGIEADRRLSEYQPYWAARASLLARLGETAAARQAYLRAIGLERDAAVRRFLQERCDAIGPSG